MQAMFTKITIGFLLLGLIVGTGMTFIVSTANLNGITPDSVLTDSSYTQSAQEARSIVYSAKNASNEAGVDANDPSDIGAARDAFNTADEQLKISTVLSSFWADLSKIIPVDQFVITTIAAIIVVLGISAGLFLLLGRNV